MGDRQLPWLGELYSRICSSIRSAELASTGPLSLLDVIRENVEEFESIEAWEVSVLAKANSFLQAELPAALKSSASNDHGQLQSLKTHEREGFARAFCGLESEVCDLTRMARLAQLQVHEAIGELRYEDGTCVESPNTESTELATFAVSMLTEKVQGLREWYRLFNEAVEAARNTR